MVTKRFVVPSRYSPLHTVKVEEKNERSGLEEGEELKKMNGRNGSEED